MVRGCAVGGAKFLLLKVSVRGFRGPEELQEASGLQVLAAMPRVAPRNVLGAGVWRFLEDEPNSAFAEAHKGIYASLRVDRRALELGHVLLVTSYAPT